MSTIPIAELVHFEEWLSRQVVDQEVTAVDGASKRERRLARGEAAGLLRALREIQRIRFAAQERAALAAPKNGDVRIDGKGGVVVWNEERKAWQAPA